MAALLWIAMAAAAAAILVSGGAAASVEHTFVVSRVKMNRLGKETPVAVVNGQLPGPTVEVTEGDSVAVHVVNESPYGIAIHWHGVKQRLNCWNDGVAMVTQCPIQPNTSFTYRFDVTGQEGTLWWHAHVVCLRATIHGAIVIRPRSGLSSYPFPKPDVEIPIVIGEWWEVNLVPFDKDPEHVSPCIGDHPRASTINGKLGDINNFSGGVEENYNLNVDHGKTYLLRIINAALYSEYFFKIAGHGFTVVAADANYVKPYTTDTIAIAPGETIDALLVADAPPAMYYMVALASQRPEPDPQVPMSVSRATLQYSSKLSEAPLLAYAPAMEPRMPDQHDSVISFQFHGNMTSLLDHTRSMLQVPAMVDEQLFLTLAVGSICNNGGDGSSSSSSSSSCNRSTESTESSIVATMNNVSFQLPAATASPLLEAHYLNKMGSIETLRELPDRPPRMFNFTDESLIPQRDSSMWLEATAKATLVRRFRYNTTVEVVFQSTSLRQSEANPMHLHGHDFFVLAQGIGNYDPERDVERYNMVDPPLKNTVQVPSMGWAAIRFITDNPGVWYMHCHYEFHVEMGMAAVFEVENGPTLDTTLPPPPQGLPRCGMAASSWNIYE